MEPREYDLLRRTEDRHWWFRSLRRFVLERLGTAREVLDAGCGTGGMLDLLRDRRATGLDLSPLALAHARGRGLTRLVRGTVERLPFADRSFDAVLALDVLYHRLVAEEGRAVAEFARVLRPGGVLMVHGAAYPGLGGAHDRAVHGARRTTAGRTAAVIRSAGLTVEELTYRNLLPLPAAVLLRFGRPEPVPGRVLPPSDVRPLPRPLDAALGWAAGAESWWLRRARLPLGLSVYCLARRPR